MEKAPDAFRTISEVADEIDVPQHVLRFWESRFTHIRPMKRGGGRRYYRPDDVDLLRGVRHLLYGEGYTIRGVQRILREQGVAFVQQVWRVGAERPPPLSDEDRAADEAAENAEDGEPLFEHDLSDFSITPAEREEARSSREKREPLIAPPPAIVPPPAIAPPARLTPATAAQLRGVIDELAECRRLIETALQQD